VTVEALRFLRRRDPDGDPIEWAELETTDLVTAVWESDLTWCWRLHRGRESVDEGLAPTRALAKLQSRRAAALALAQDLQLGSWS